MKKKQRKRAGVRSPRNLPARPTKKTSLREGGRQFATGWTYLDVENKGGGSSRSSGAGRGPAERSHRSLPSRSAVYFAPTKPFARYADAELSAWFEEQDEEYRDRVRRFAARGGRSVLEYLRKTIPPPCPCGFDGNPRAVHVFGLKCMDRGQKPVQLEDEDDDLPF